MKVQTSQLIARILYPLTQLRLSSQEHHNISKGAALVLLSCRFVQEILKIFPK